MHYSNHPVTKEYRQILRRTTTPTENMLWRRLEGVLERIREYINRVIINKTEAVQTPVAP